MVHMTMMGGNPLKKFSKDLNDFTIDEIVQTMEEPRLAKMVMETTLMNSMTVFLPNGNVVKYEYDRKENKVYKIMEEM